MAVATLTELIAALTVGDFGEVLGTPESGWVDFKRAPYGMIGDGNFALSPKGRWELCKDVAELANDRGGALVLGIGAVKDLTSGIEIARELHPIRLDVIDLNAYRDTIGRGVYPPVRNLRLVWCFEDPSQPGDSGVLLVEVPEQEAGSKPFVVRQMYSDELGKATGAIGIPVRNGDRTDWYDAVQVHHLIQIAERRSEVQIVPGETPVVHSRLSADEARSAISALQGWEDDAIYYLQALPPRPEQEIEGFYGTTGVAQELLRPNSLRPRGFNLTSLGNGEWVEGGFVVRRENDAAIRLDPNGMLTVGVPAGPAFLGWGLDSPTDPPNAPVKVNSTVLVEFTFEICRFVHYALRPHKETSGWRYEVRCVHFRSSGVRLGPGAPRQFPRPTFPSFEVASSDNWRKSIDSRDDAGKDAFAVLSAVYALFSLGEQDIPYRVDARIDEELVRQLD